MRARVRWVAQAGRSVSLALLACGVNAAEPVTLPEPVVLADFQFTGRVEESAGRGAIADLKNAAITSAGLELTRGYENAGDGYRATFTVPQLTHTNVSFVVDLAPWDLGLSTPRRNPLDRITARLLALFGVRVSSSDHRNLITAGESHRWLGFNHAPGWLQLTLNNQNFRCDFTNVVLTTRRWHRLACSLDVAGGGVQVALDGKMLEPTRLPDGFVLAAAKATPADGDRNFTFANYSNGQAFYGNVARLRVFGRALKPAELVALGGADLPPLPNPRRTVRWLVAVVLVGLVVLVSWRAARQRRKPVGDVA
jgi:hypothetical protein